MRYLCVGGEPRRAANGFGKEFIAVAGPGQPDDLANTIQRLEADWLAKAPDQISAVPPAIKYTYLTREQEWRARTTNERTGISSMSYPQKSPRCPYVLFITLPRRRKVLVNMPGWEQRYAAHEKRPKNVGTCVPTEYHLTKD